MFNLATTTFQRLLVITILAAGCGRSNAAEFTVATKIFVADVESPVAEHRILFADGLVYDLPQTDDRIATVYDAANGKIVLLDRESQQQTILGLEDLLRITAEAKASIDGADDRNRFGLNAQVISENGYRIEFAGTEYRVQAETPSDPGIAADYGRFADLALRMNIVRPTGPPPFARMTLNSHIAARGEFPRESNLKISHGEQTIHYRSANQIGELTTEDRQQIERIQTELADYRQVPLADFPPPQ
jgi:hypothetical protein